MPPRSVVLNVSITARGMGKSEVVESVRELDVMETAQQDLGTVKSMHNGKAHDRVDSVSSVSPLSPQPSLTDLASAAVSPTTSTNAIPALVPSTPVCATCTSTTKPNGSALAHCKACATVHYCSMECQRRDWPMHKRNCTFRSHSSRSVSRTSSVPPSPQPASPDVFVTTSAATDGIQSAKTDEVLRKDSVQEEGGGAMDVDV